MSFYSVSVKFRFTRVLLVVAVAFCFLPVQIGAINNEYSCGKRQLLYRFAITKGRASDISQWPWHAAIYRNINSSFKYACGGTIIDRKTILTAAHCLFVASKQLHANQILVYVGKDHLNATSDSEKVLNVARLIIYPDYTISRSSHDIAIVKLSSSILMNNFIQPACLWSEDEEERIVGKQGTIIGFGKTENDSVSEYLQEANLTAVDALKCVEDARASVANVLTRNMYCAGGKLGVSACHGDSGGGMFFMKNDSWYLRGIVSFIASALHDGSCENSNYTVFTDVNKYLHWIYLFNNTQYSLIDNHFVLISFGSKLVSIPLSRGDNPDVLQQKYGFGPVYDCLERRVYGIEDDHRGIFNVDLNGEGRKNVIRVLGPIKNLAVDWISRRLFWYDLSKKVIEVISLENPDNRTVVISGLAYVLDIDPHRGKLYWLSNTKTNEKQIEWSNLDGTNRATLLGPPTTFFLGGMKVFMATGELCYTNRSSAQISCIDTESKQIRTIAETSQYPDGLVITDSLFYWMDFHHQFIESINMDGERQPTILIPKSIRQQVGSTLFFPTMTAITDKCLISESPCAVNNGGCPENTICLINTSDPLGKNCTVVSSKN